MGQVQQVIHLERVVVTIHQTMGEVHLNRQAVEEVNLNKTYAVERSDSTIVESLPLILNFLSKSYQIIPRQAR